jgi:methanethiol S-methyltransferase
MFKRSLFFVYGLSAYLIFLATFLYAIAFVGGLAVPRRLDGPLETTLPAALAIDCLLLTIFAVQHSVMARRWFKERWTQIVPWTIERSTYVLCASLALLLLFWQWRPIGVQVWSVENATARAVLWTLFAAGWATVLTVTCLINHFDLFGLRQVWLPLIGRPYTRIEFRTPMPYRYIRHPLYFGFLLAFWMTPSMTLAHLVFALATTGYIVLAIQFEERDLVHEHGAAYQEYCREVPMLLPTGRRAGRTSATKRKAGAAATVGMLALAASSPLQILAEEQHSHPGASDASALVAVVRDTTERFKDVAIAEAAGYGLQFGCVSGPDWGAMGLHYVNFPLVLDGELDARQPEIVIYEPLPNGRLRLIGADYLVLADAWHAKHPEPPQIMGQLLHLFEAPNRFGLPAFYTLHVWAWKDNPSGTFVNWHKNVSCDAFGGGH